MADDRFEDKSIKEPVTVIDIERAQEERRKKREKSMSKKKKAQRKKESPETRSRKRRLKLSKRRLTIILALLVMVALVAISAGRIITLKTEQKKIEDEKAAKAAEKKKLEVELQRINDPEYIEQQARERLRMIRQGEILYVFPDAEEDNTQ